MITLEDIRVHIGNKVLLENASCQLVDGQKVGIIGKNGHEKDLKIYLDAPFCLTSGERDIPKLASR